MKNLPIAVVASCVILFAQSEMVLASAITFLDAASLAADLARAPKEQRGLGCNYSAVVKVDDGYRSDNTEIIRTVLYADCIPCLHVYMFKRKTGELVFSKSIVLSDPVSYQETCVKDRNQALGK